MTRWYDEEDGRPWINEDEPIDGVGFADPGGESALRAATKDNPRNLPCPSCGWPNRLTPIDKARGYQCDSCARAAETGQDINYYEPETEDNDDETDDDGEEVDTSGDPEYKYSVVMLIQVDVTASSQEVAIEKATTSSTNWDDWNLVDTPAGPEIVNTDP